MLTRICNILGGITIATAYVTYGESPLAWAFIVAESAAVVALNVADDVLTEKCKRR